MANKAGTRSDLSTRHADKMKLATYEPEPVLSEYTQLRYDYSQVAEKHRRMVQDAAVDINRKQHRARQDMFAIGRRLLEIKEILPHGQFGRWLAVEFDLEERTAQRIMNAARVFRDEAKATRVSLLSDGAIYLLAAPSTPEAAREEVDAILVGSGKPLVRDEIQRIIDAHRPAPRMIDVQATTVVARPVEAQVIDISATLDEANPTCVSDLEDGGGATTLALPEEAANPTRVALLEDGTVEANATPTDDQPTADELAAMAEVVLEAAEEDQERAARAAARLSPADNAPELVLDAAAPLTFDAWLAAMPPVEDWAGEGRPNVRECLAILELAKVAAKRALDLEGGLYNAVYGALPTWSHLIREVGKVAGR